MFIEDFRLFIKQCYHIVWSVEKNTESKNLKVPRTKHGKIMLLSKCAVPDSKKSKCIKLQKSSWLLINLRIETPLTN